MYTRDFAILYICVVAASGGAAFPKTAAADSLFLKNGDRLSGVLQSIAEGKVLFSTEYTGELAVSLDALCTIQTDSPIAWLLDDGTIETARLAVIQERRAEFPQENVVDLERVLAASHEPHALLLPPPAEGIPPLDAAEEKPKLWTGAVDAGLSLRSGETDTLDAHTGIEAVRKTERRILTLGLNGAYGEVDSEVNTRRLNVYGKLQYYPKERFYLFGHSAATHDPGTRLELRVEIGGGPGWDVVKNDLRTLSLELGLDYTLEYWNRYSIRELEDAKSTVRAAARNDLYGYTRRLLQKPLDTWASGDIVTAFELGAKALVADVGQETTEDSHVNARLVLAYTQKLFTNSTLSETLVLLPDVDDPSEYRVTSDLAFDTPLSEQLNLRINLKTDYDSQVAAGESECQFENTLITSLRYQF
jgi:putative salt-induced outer membrane protein YdiY